MAMRSDRQAGPGAVRPLSAAVGLRLRACCMAVSTGAVAMAGAPPAAAQSFCAGIAAPAAAPARPAPGETVTTDVTEAPAAPPAPAAMPPGGRACDEVTLAGFRVAAVLVQDRKVPRPKPGTPFAGPAGFPVPAATLDGRLRVDLFIARAAGQQDAPTFECTRTIIAPGGAENGPAAIGCEARAIPAGSGDFRAANFRLGLRQSADDPKGLWQVRIGLRDQLNGGRAELLLAYPFGQVAQ